MTHNFIVQYLLCSIYTASAEGFALFMLSKHKRKNDIKHMHAIVRV